MTRLANSETRKIRWSEALARPGPQPNYKALQSGTGTTKSGKPKWTLSRRIPAQKYSFLLCESLRTLRLCGCNFFFFNRRGAEYAEIRREEKKSKSESQHTSAQRFGCGLGHAMISVNKILFVERKTFTKNKKWPDSSTESSALLFSVFSAGSVDTLSYYFFLVTDHSVVAAPPRYVKARISVSKWG